MKQLSLCLGFLSVFSAVSVPAEAAPARGAGRPAIAVTATSHLAAHRPFEANHGQLPEGVRFGWRGTGMAVHLRDAAFEVLLHGGRRLRLGLAGGNPLPDVVALEPLAERRSFFLGSRRERWVTGVPTFGRVLYRAVYPGIDAAFYGRGGVVELDFLVAPQADPARIRLDFAGADRIAVEPDRSLRLVLGGRALRLRQPIAYQEGPQGRTAVGVEYVVRKRRQVSLALGAYDRSRPLIIDPVLDWATYFGGSANDSIYVVKTAADGHVLVAGVAQSPDLPMTAGAAQPALAGFTDGFVSKISAAGDAVLSTTYLGGSGPDGIWDMAIDASGAVYVTGSTISIDFPTTAGAFDDSFNDPSDDVFVAKLSADFSQVLYSTYLGGTQIDGIGQALAIDQDGFAYVAGRTLSADFPTTPGAFDETYNGLPGHGPDVFVSKLDVDGSALVYSTFLGGASSDYVFAGGLAIDALGDLYVAGSTGSQDFPLTPGALGSPPNGFDFFLTKLDPDGGVIYSAAFGGSDNDGGNPISVAVDTDGGVLVVGETLSLDWPVVGGGMAGASTDGSSPDVVLAKLDGSGSTLLFSGYLGGTGEDTSRRAVLGDDGFLYIIGGTKSADFPVTADALRPVLESSDPEDLQDDAFLCRVNAATGLLDYASFFGGVEFDTGTGIAYAGDGTVYLVGHTASPDFPVSPGSLGTAPRFSYVAKLAFGSAPDGVLGAAGGTVADAAGTGAAFAVAAGVLAADIALSIEVLPDPGADPPPGFSAFGTHFVSFVLDPNPSPLPSPGATITLPLDDPLAEGTPLDLFKYDPDAGTFVDTGIDGTVDAGGATATFAGVTDFSTFVGLVREAPPADTTPPVLSLSTAGITVTLPSAASAGAVIDLSGVASAIDAVDPAPVVSNDAPSLFPIGKTTVTFTARDASGNSSQAQLVVHVVYAFDGFFAPIRNDGSSIFKAGRVIPMKFQLRGADGSIVGTATATLQVFKFTDDVLGATEEQTVEAAGNSNTDNLFRYDATSGQYIYNGDSTGYTQGSYSLRVTPNDQTVHEVVVSVRP